MLQPSGSVRMHPITVRQVKKTQPAIVAVQQKPRQPLQTQRGLIGMMTRSNGPRAYCEKAGTDSSLAQRNRVEGCNLPLQRRSSERAPESPRAEHPCAENL